MNYTRSVSSLISKNLFERVKAICKKYEITLSAFIRRGVRLNVEVFEKKDFEDINTLGENPNLPRSDGK